MLPFALSRFVTAHFTAPKQEPEASARWRTLHGHSFSLGLQSYVALGGMAGHVFTPKIDAGNEARARSQTPFEDALNEAQASGSQLPLLEPFAGTLGLGHSNAGDPFFALVSVRSERAPVVGWNPARAALNHVCADDVTSFAALNFIAAHVLGKGKSPAGRAIKSLIGALDNRAAFPPPFTPLEDRFAVDDLFPVEWIPDPAPNRFYLRASYLMAMLIEGNFSLDAWAAYDQPAPDPIKALRNIPRSAPTAMYWLFRLFFEGHDDALGAAVDAASSSKATWISDAARVVSELRKGRNELGTIDDVAALRETMSRVVRDPSMLAARKAAQRRDTVNKRILSMRVPSGLRFEPVDKVPEGDDAATNEFETTEDGSLAVVRDGETHAVLPPEPGATFLQGVSLRDDLFAVLSELPGEKATRRRVTVYQHGHRTSRLGGHVFHDVMGASGIVKVSDDAIALWKEAVEEERMFPWTGRSTVYGLIEGNLVSLGGASYDCTGTRVIDGEVYALRADGSGYHASEIAAAIENQSAHHSGPRFSPIPLTDATSQEGWRDVYDPGPVTREGGLLRWKHGPLPRSAACPKHLHGELGVSIARDGRVAWLMTRTGNRIDRLDLSTGQLSKLTEWPAEEGWPVGVAEAGDDLVVVSTWKLRVLKVATGAVLWSKAIEEAQSVAGLPSRHFAVLARGASGPGILSVFYVRDLPEAPENEADAGGEWSSYGYSGERLSLFTTSEAIAIVGEQTRGFLDPAVVDKIPHWARSRGWFGDPGDGDHGHDHDHDHHYDHDHHHDH